MGMVNFLEDTVDILKANGHSTEDVLWIGTDDGKEVLSWEMFKAQADFEYPNGFGTPMGIKTNLVVVGKNWWMDRHDYDGLEGWVYHKKPKLNPPVVGLKNLRDEE